VWASNAALKPAGIPDLVAAACPTSAVTADEFVHRVACVRRGERVLVLGGAGGVGSAVVQYAKLAGASFVATTTTQTALLTRLGADAAIDYRTGPGWCVPRAGDAEGALVDGRLGGGVR
jgi:NADPH:quinone reductase